MTDLSMEEIGLAYCVITLFAEVMYLLPGPGERRLDEFIQLVNENYPTNITEDHELSDEVRDLLFPGDDDETNG